MIDLEFQEFQLNLEVLESEIIRLKDTIERSNYSNPAVELQNFNSKADVQFLDKMGETLEDKRLKLLEKLLNKYNSEINKVSFKFGLTSNNSVESIID